MVLHSGEIFDATAPDEDVRVLGEVRSLSGIVRRNHHAIGQPDTNTAAARAIGLLRLHDIDPENHAPLLGAALKGPRLVLPLLLHALFSH